MSDFKMSLPSVTSDGGDLIFTESYEDSDGNLITDCAVSSGEDEITQLVYAVVRTQAPDFTLHPSLGGNLEDLIGMPNTRATGQLGASKIATALSGLPLLTGYTINVTASPASKDQILFLINITNGANSYIFPVSFDLARGTQFPLKELGS